MERCGHADFHGQTIHFEGSGDFSKAAAGWSVLAVAKLAIENLGNYEESDLLTLPKRKPVPFLCCNQHGGGLRPQG